MNAPPGAGAADPRVAAIAEFVAARAACESASLSDLRPLAGGAIQENYALDLDVPRGPWAGRHALVLRTDAASAVQTSLGRAEEFAVLRAAHEAGVTVPEPLWLCEDPSVLGRPFYLMRRADGVAAGHRVARDPALAGDAGDRLAERLGAELGRLHRIRPPHPELDFLPEPGPDAAGTRIATYRGYLDALPAPQPALEWGLRWLERNAPPPGEVVLTHSDYRTGNYLVAGGELTAILDWEFASWSDPMEDVGWFCARCWRFGAWEREAGGIGSRAAFYRGYERGAGVPVAREWVPYWEVMAAVRWAVIALQQAERHCSGREPSLELALTGHMVAEMELEMMDGIETIRSRARR